MKIRLSRPYLGDRRELSVLIKKILESGFFTQGKYVCKFEEGMSKYLGVRYAVAVNSGTSALHLALIALGIGPKDEVIVPAYTFPATANVVELVGARPVFVDVDIDTYNIDAPAIEKVVTARTKAIIPVHLFGNPADMGPIMSLAKRKRIAVVEDAAGALGSHWKGIKCGTIGRAGCFSFHPRKVITTCEGGMVVTDDRRLADKIRILRNHGMTLSKNRHDFIVPGFNYRMNELEAALGIVQVKELRSVISERQGLAERYKKSFADMSEVSIQVVLPECSSTWQAFVIRMKNRNIARVLNYLRKSGIEANIGTYAIHILKFYSAKYGYRPDDYPNALQLYKEGLALPFFNGLRPEGIETIKNRFRRL